MVADVVHTDDVPVLQARGRACFAHERSAAVGSGQAGVEQLERDGATEGLLHREIDGGHAAAAKLTNDPVAGNLGHRCLP